MPRAPNLGGISALTVCLFGRAIAETVTLEATVTRPVIWSILLQSTTRERPFCEHLSSSFIAARNTKNCHWEPRGH